MPYRNFAVAFKIGKTTGKDELLESLHTVLFGSKGKALARKKAIQGFSGFAFDESKTVSTAWCYVHISRKAPL